MMGAFMEDHQGNVWLGAEGVGVSERSSDPRAWGLAWVPAFPKANLPIHG